MEVIVILVENFCQMYIDWKNIMMLIIGKSNVKFAVLIFQVCTTYIEMNYFGIYLEKK